MELWDQDPEEVEDNETHVIPWQLRCILIFISIWQFCFIISDAAVTALIFFLSKFFKLISRNCNEGDTLQQFSNAFPKTLKGAMKLIGVSNENFTQYIVCPLCHSVYNYDFGYVIENNIRIPNCCIHVKMPNHPSAAYRQPCGVPLMKTVKGRGGSGNISLKPFRVFPYQSLKDALKILISRKGFLDHCEHWRTRGAKLPAGILGDIYEGAVWRDFFVVDGVSFLQSRYNLCFTLNVDWFQPFTHTRKL